MNEALSHEVRTLPTGQDDEMTINDLLLVQYARIPTAQKIITGNTVESKEMSEAKMASMNEIPTLIVNTFPNHVILK